MVALVDINAELLQLLQQLLGLLVARQRLVKAPLGHVQRDRQLKASEVHKVLRASVSTPPESKQPRRQKWPEVMEAHRVLRISR